MELEAALLDAANSTEFQELVQGRYVGITPMGADDTAASIDTISNAMEAVINASGS
jgi:hypothetical protein